MYTVYILKSVNYPKTYVGYTDNLQRRLSEHNSGKSNYTSQFIPWEIIHSESHADIEKATKREKYFKSCAGRKKIKTILSK